MFQIERLELSTLKLDEILSRAVFELTIKLFMRHNGWLWTITYGYLHVNNHFKTILIINLMVIANC